VIPDIVDVRDLAWACFLVPPKKFLRLCGGLGDKKCFSAIRGRKSRGVYGNRRGYLFDCAIRAEGAEFRVKAISADGK
jgi:hypothetical protein